MRSLEFPYDTISPPTQSDPVMTELNTTNTLSENMADLRERLDREGEERRQLTSMLTDQRTGLRAKRGLFGFIRSA